jgi:hypothetical protein
MSDENTTNRPNATAILRPLIDGCYSLSDDSLRLAVKDVVERLWSPDGSDTFEVLVTSMIVGADERRIMEIMGIPTEIMKRLAGNLRQHGVWQGKQVPVKYWLHPRLGYWNLLCDGLVAQGKMMRRFDPNRGVVYWMPDDSAHLN